MATPPPPADSSSLASISSSPHLLVPFYDTRSPAAMQHTADHDDKEEGSSKRASASQRGSIISGTGNGERGREDSAGGGGATAITQTRRRESSLPPPPPSHDYSHRDESTTHPPPPPPLPPASVNVNITRPPPAMRQISDSAIVRDRVGTRQNTRPVSHGSLDKEAAEFMLDDLPMSPSGRELNLNIDRPDRRVSRYSNNTGNGNGNRRGRISRRTTALDYIVPDAGPLTVQQRMQKTIDHANEEKTKYTRKAQMTGYALNVAIGLQVVISALITGLSAVTSGKQTSIMTSILGGLGTVVASYLARARGSNEPELSIARSKDLEKFLRDCESFVNDYGFEHGHEHDAKIEHLRTEFEQLLGNADSQRKLAPPV